MINQSLYKPLLYSKFLEKQRIKYGSNLSFVTRFPPAPLDIQPLQRRRILTPLTFRGEIMLNEKKYLSSNSLITVFLFCLFFLTAISSEAQEKVVKTNSRISVSEESIVLNNQASGQALQKKYDEAILLFEQAIAKSPKFAVARFNLANTLVRAEDYERAIRLFKELIADESDYTSAHAALGEALLDAYRPAEAIISFRRALELSPDNHIYHFKLGVALNDTQNYEDSLAEFNRAIKLAPEFASAHNGKGALLATLDKLDEAVASLEKAIALDASFADAYSNLGVVLTRLGKKKLAHKNYLKAAELRPNSTHVQYNLSLSFLTRGDRETALRHFAVLKKLDAHLAGELSKLIYRDYILDARTNDERTMSLHTKKPSIIKDEENQSLPLLRRFL